MKKEDFKKIKLEHIKTCRELISHNGNCEEIDCKKCPFTSTNSVDSINKCETSIVKTLKKAKEFLEMCKCDEVATEEDRVNSPKHYKLPGLNIESIDIIRALLGKYFKWFCLGNIVKYILRAEKKNGLEDYKKARKYLDWLIKEEENGN